MRSRKLKTIARRWWPSKGGDYDWDRLHSIVDSRLDLVPGLIRTLVRSAPQGGDRYVGTAVVEDLDFAVHFGRRVNRTADLLLRAGLTQAELFGVLSGVYASHLESIGVREAFREVLSEEQLDWLMDDGAPHRWADDGTMVADGPSMRFVEGQTEWSRLYWSGNTP